MSIGPNEPTPIAATCLSLKKSTTFANVVSGCSVGKLTLSNTSPRSLPMPHTNFVPPASTAPINTFFPRSYEGDRRLRPKKSDQPLRNLFVRIVHDDLALRLVE